MSAVMKEEAGLASMHEAAIHLALEARRTIRRDDDEDAGFMWASQIAWKIGDGATVGDCLDGASCYLTTALGTFDREENMADCDHAGVILVNMAAKMVASAHAKLMAYDRDVAPGQQLPQSANDIALHRAAILEAILVGVMNGIAEQARETYINDPRMSGSDVDFVHLVGEMSDFVHDEENSYNLAYGHAFGILDRLDPTDDEREKLMEEFGLMHYPITNPVARQQALADRVREIVAAQRTTIDAGTGRREEAIRLTGLPIDVIPQFDTLEDGIEAVHTLLQQVNATMQRESDNFSQQLWSALQQLDLAQAIQSQLMGQLPRKIAA